MAEAADGREAIDLAMKLRADVLLLDITMPRLNGIAVAAGKAFFSPEISRMLVDDYMRRLEQLGVEDSYELLSLREREVIEMPFARVSSCKAGRA